MPYYLGFSCESALQEEGTLIPYSFDCVLSCDSDFQMVNNKVTSDYDLTEGQILEWGHLREVPASRDFLASFWPPMARISQLSFGCLTGELCKVQVLVLISQILI